MKKAFIFALLTIVFTCQPSFAFKNGEFTFGIDKILTYGLENSINYSDGKRDKIERKIMRKGGKEEEVEIVEKVDNVLKATVSKDYGNNGFAPKVEYCYSLSDEHESDVKTSVGLGVNKFFNSDFDPFNVYAIAKIVVPSLNDRYNIIPIDAKINTVYEVVKSVEENITYDIIMLGIGHKFTI